MPGNTDVVAVIEQLRQREVAFTQGVLTDVDLNAPAAVGQHEEAGFAEAANADDAPCRDRLDAVRLELLFGPTAMRVNQRRCRVGGFEAIRVRANTKLHDGGKVGASLLDLVV